jgi:uncharacterized protein YkwD
MKINWLYKKNTFIALAIAIVCGLWLSSCEIVSDSLAATPEQHDAQLNILAAHNRLRAQHHAPDLTWDNTLARYAARHAGKCKFRHSSSPYGENLAAGYPSASLAVNAWYAERAQYSYSHPGFSSRTGHFTQMVWKSSKKLGCAYASCNGKNGTPGKYWVCEYSPAGNVVNRGYFEANVLP